MAHIVVWLVVLAVVVASTGCGSSSGATTAAHPHQRARRPRQQDDGFGVPATQLRLHGGMRACLQATHHGGVQLHPCHVDSADQWWALQPQPEDINAIVLRLEDSPSCVAIDAAVDSLEETASVHLAPCSSSALQRFYIFKTSFAERGGMVKGYAIQSLQYPHLCLDGNMRATLSTALRLAPCQDSAFQVFHGDMLALLAQPAEARVKPSVVDAPSSSQTRAATSKEAAHIERVEELRAKLKQRQQQQGQEHKRQRRSSTHTSASSSQRQDVLRVFADSEWRGRSSGFSCCGKHRLRQPVHSILLKPGYHAVLYGGWKCDEVLADLAGSTNNASTFTNGAQVQCLQALALQPSVHLPSKSAPSSVSAFSEEDFQGREIKLPTIAAPNIYQTPIASLFHFHEDPSTSDTIASLRIPAGSRVFLHHGDRQAGGRLLVRDVRGGLEPSEFTHASITWMPWSQLRGVVFCPRPLYHGHCQYYTLGLYDVPAEGLGSIFIARPGYRVKLLNKDSRLITAIDNNTTDTSHVFELEKQRPASFLVGFACENDCNKHGRCIGANVCTCHKGWKGEFCQYGPPDFTSVIVCDSNTAVAGSPLHCIIRPRHAGLPTAASGSDFQLQPDLDAITHVSLRMLPPPAVNLGTGASHDDNSSNSSDEIDALSERDIHFEVTANHSTSGHERLFTAVVVTPLLPQRQSGGDGGEGEEGGDEGDDHELDVLNTPVIAVFPRWSSTDVQVSCGQPVHSLLDATRRYDCILTTAPRGVYTVDDDGECGSSDKHNAGGPPKRASADDEHTDAGTSICVPTVLDALSCRIEDGGAKAAAPPLSSSSSSFAVSMHASNADAVGCSFKFSIDVMEDGNPDDDDAPDGTDEVEMDRVSSNADNIDGGDSADDAAVLVCGYVYRSGQHRSNSDESSSSSSSSSDGDNSNGSRGGSSGQAHIDDVSFEDRLIALSVGRLLEEEKQAHVLSRDVTRQLAHVHALLRAYEFDGAVALLRYMLLSLERNPVAALMANAQPQYQQQPQQQSAKAVAIVQQVQLTLNLLLLDVLGKVGRFQEALLASNELRQLLALWGETPSRTTHAQVSALEARASRGLEVLQTLTDMLSSSGDVDESATDMCSPATITALSAVLVDAPASATYRRWRAECHLRHGNASAALADASMLVRLDKADARTLRLHGAIHWRLLGNTEVAATVLAKCIRISTPDAGARQLCKREEQMMRRVLSLAAEAKQFKDQREFLRAIHAFDTLLALDAHSEMALTALQELCELHFFVNRIDAALHSCTRALEDVRLQENSQFVVHLLMYRAWAFLTKEMFSNALRDVKRARRISPHDMKLLVLQRKIELAVKEATTKDYYSILGVPKGASTAVIRRAYRRLVRVWHPDKNKHPDAEQKFLDIVEAYEVLMDDELRAAYDKGVDITEYMERRKRSQQQEQEQDSSADETDSSSHGRGKQQGQQQREDDASDDDDDDGSSQQRQQQRSKRSRQATRDITLPQHCCITHQED